ncbi:hypothetical protein EYF80_064846 [Liparis tanakae]|uniref:Uncharacterized protein n=1 Tax=Liparis tanakae TaxID=230148 RepID=A0A4Z2E896_9TELE|nr:hypothetical protein EYF80_064846 [Liparis tanakae]
MGGLWRTGWRTGGFPGPPFGAFKKEKATDAEWHVAPPPRSRTCPKCGERRTRATGHFILNRETFCQKSDPQGRTVEHRARGGVTSSKRTDGDKRAQSRMDYAPAFRWTDSNQLMLRPSPEAEAFCRQQEGVRPLGRPKNLPAVTQDARDRVVAGGGDCTDNKLLLSRFEMQLGKYRGQSFHWLAIHDIGYLVMIVADHAKARTAGDCNTGALMSNKDALWRYARMFPEVNTESLLTRMRQRSSVARASRGV